MGTVLVTGGSGFIGGHCILQLLAAGHQVHTTVRSLKRESDVRTTLKGGGRLSFIAADLEKDAGWPDAVAGCEYVLDVASLRLGLRNDSLVNAGLPADIAILREA